MKRIFVAAMFAFILNGAHAQDATQSSELSLSEMTVAPGQTGINSIVGIAANTSGRLLHGAVIKFNLYDAQGNLVGNTIAVANNVEAGAHWRFEAPIPYSAAVSYKAVEVNTF